MNYKKEVQKYTNQFTEQTQKLAITAIKRLRSDEFCHSWEWIYTALNMKDPDVWEIHGLGLLFLDVYDKQVIDKMNRKRKAKTLQEQAEKVDIDAFWAEELAKPDEE